jgi:hypothetical protein
MNKYTPDTWVILRIKTRKQPPIYKLFAGWYGGYTQGDSWKLNSGITIVKTSDKFYEVHGESGSIYVCPIGREGMSTYMYGVLASFQEQFKGKASIKVITMHKYMSSV